MIGIQEYLFDLGSERYLARNRERNVMNKGDASAGRIKVGRGRPIQYANRPGQCPGNDGDIRVEYPEDVVSGLVVWAD